MQTLHRNTALPPVSTTICARAALGLVFTLVAAVTSGGWASDSGAVRRDFTVEAAFFSVVPDDPLASYRPYGSGSAGRSATLGFACRDAVRRFKVDIVSNTKAGRWQAVVKVRPSSADTVTEGATHDLDLSDLTARSLEIARDDDGRVYMLSLTPGVRITDNTPRPFDPVSMRLTHWGFSQSTVIINDQDYAGKMSASNGPLAFLEIPDIGKIEFALTPFRNAKPSGSLKDGRLRIEDEDGTTIEIYNVTNGVHGLQLPGGPHQVWVRESAPSPEVLALRDPNLSVDEALTKAKQVFRAEGVYPPPDEALRQMIESERAKKHSVLSFGVGPIGKKDRIAVD